MRYAHVSCRCRRHIAQTVLPADVNRLLDGSMDVPCGICPINVEDAIQLPVVSQLDPNALELILVNRNPRIECRAPRLLEVDGCPLVPHSIVRAQQLHEHNHVDPIHGPEHAATENRTHIVPSFPIQR